MALSTSSASCDGEYDRFAPFEKVLEAIDQAALPIIASDVRGTPCELEEEMYAGSYNLVFCLTFADGTKWAARIPQHGTREYFDKTAAQTMRDEADLICLIRSQTSIPMPAVYYQDTGLNNLFGAPFTLMEWVGGNSAHQMWYDTFGPTPLETRRLRILDSIASVTAQMAFLSSSMISLPKASVSQDGEVHVSEHGQIRICDPYNEEVASRHTSDPYPVVFHGSGPFKSSTDYLRSILDNAKLNSLSASTRGARKMLHIIIDAIATLQSDAAEPKFVLTHPDLDWQNIRVSEDGAIVSLLDWDGVHFVPPELGYSRYPKFICRDWHPEWYFLTPLNPTEYKHTPSELREYRKIYRGMVALHAGEAGNQTINSHVFEGIKNACEDPDLIYGVVTKICRICIKDCPFKVDVDDDCCTHFLNKGSDDCSGCESIFSYGHEEGFESSYEDCASQLDPIGPAISESGAMQKDEPYNGDAGETQPLIQQDGKSKYAAHQQFFEAHPSLAIAIQLTILTILIVGWILSLVLTFGWTLIGIGICASKALYEDDPVSLGTNTLHLLRCFGRVLAAPFEWLQPASFNATSVDRAISGVVEIGAAVREDETESETDRSMDADKDFGNQLPDFAFGSISSGDGEMGKQGREWDHEEEKDLYDEERNREEDEEDDSGSILDPNDRDPWWFMRLFEHLEDGKLSSAQIGVLENCFAEVLSSKEVIEEWDLN